MSDTPSRRPLKVRDATWSKNIASYLSRQNITPNQISIMSIVFSLLAALCIIVPDKSTADVWPYSLLAALLIQMRLLCNLFDGMVAMEGGKSTKSGELYNDIPDRVSDSILFIALGYAISSIELGYLAALFAMMTAYVRVLGASMNAGSVFKGPMAKQHRMALMTIGLILTPLETLFFEQSYLLYGVLVIIVSGSVLTVLNRIYSIYSALETKVE
ncbi:MAG: CDP-alcohol phosphatidyltransferase family protein [Sulfuricurvum sp.]|jgi:phosphatidylglycerophosphate synthase